MAVHPTAAVLPETTAFRQHRHPPTGVQDELPIDLDTRWCRPAEVALRPEPFGALLYHFGTRRLTFLKDPDLADLVGRLDGSASPREVWSALGLPAWRLPAIAAALAVLAATDMIRKGA